MYVYSISVRKNKTIKEIIPELMYEKEISGL